MSKGEYEMTNKEKLIEKLKNNTLTDNELDSISNCVMCIYNEGESCVDCDCITGFTEWLKWEAKEEHDDCGIIAINLYGEEVYWRDFSHNGWEFIYFPTQEDVGEFKKFCAENRPYILNKYFDADVDSPGFYCIDKYNHRCVKTTDARDNLITDIRHIHNQLNTLNDLIAKNSNSKKAKAECDDKIKRDNKIKEDPIYDYLKTIFNFHNK